MPFDTKSFMKAKFTPRTEDVPVPDLADFFPAGAEPVWTVRGLTGQELGRVNESASRQKVSAALMEALMAGSDKERKDAATEMLGISTSAPEDVAKRIDQLVMGSVRPTVTQDVAVRLCEVYPIEFYTLTNAVLKLTGQGQLPGKSKPSGGKKESGPLSPSATCEGDASTK